MTRSEFDIACKLSIGFVLEDACIYSMDKYLFGNIIVIHGFTVIGVNFNIDKETFMEYSEFMDIVPHINHRMVFDGRKGILDSMDVFPNSFYAKIVP